MKVKFLKNTMAAGRIYNAEEEADINSALAATVIEQGQAEKVVPPKPEKPEKPE